jgi:hypothetical protein
MKKLILATAFLGIFAATAFALGNNDAPAAVKSKFASLYPKVTKVKWDKEDTNWEAGFELDKVEMSCLFDATGNLLATESEIDISSLPRAAIEYMSKNYAGEKIKEAAKIVDSKNITTYEAEIKDGDIIFDATGKFLNKIVATKKTDEKEEKK